MRSRATVGAVVALACSVLACAGAAPEPDGPVIAPGTPIAGEAEAAPATDGAAAGEVATEAPAPPADPAPAYCSDDCLLLLEHDYSELQDGKYCDLCGPHDDNACSLDWPSSDLMACDRFDFLRNCIYARLGYEFDSAPEWREVFDKEPWYQPDPKFDWSRVTPVQAGNAKTLKAIVSRRQCSRR